MFIGDHKIRIRLYRHFTAICLVIYLIFSSGFLQAQNKQNIHVGVNAIWGDKIARSMWQPTIDYLNHSIPQYNFHLVTLNLNDIHSSVAKRKIHFIATNPGNYIELEMAYGVTRLLTLNKVRQGIPSTQFGAVIFSRADKKNIKSIYDLRGKSFAAVSKTAFGGFQMAWRELKQYGLDPYKDFMAMQFTGFPQDNVVYAVRDGKAEAGTVRTDTLERMAREGLINLAEFKILAPKKLDGFPFLLSTQLYPEWPFASLSHTSPKLAKQVTTALLELSKDSRAARSAKSVGWTIPMDYHPVRELMQELAIGPYSLHNKISLYKAVEKYWWLLAILFLSIAPPLLAYISRLKNKKRAQI